MPPWETIVVALSSGVGGTVIGALLNNSHQRGAELRNLRLTASAEFVRRADKVRRVIREPHPHPEGDGFTTVRDALDDLIEAVEIVVLMFGDRSLASDAAKVAANDLHDARDSLRAVVENASESPEMAEEYGQYLRAASCAMERFGDAARAEIWDGHLRSMVKRMRVWLVSVQGRRVELNGRETGKRDGQAGCRGACGRG